MEGLEHGWKKSAKLYHFFESGKFHSLCFNATYYRSEFKENLFYADFEIEPGMKLCAACKGFRNHDAKYEVVLESNVLKTGPDTHVLKQFICSEPGCKESGVAYEAINREKKPHYCIKHNLRVKIARKKKVLEASASC